MYGYIYETTNLINNKRYVGQKKSEVFLENRYLGSGKILSRAIKKYGAKNFSVKLIEKCSSKEELNEREIYWIKYYEAVNSKDFYNLTSGGFGLGGYHHTTESKIKIGNATRGNKSWKGKFHSEESKMKISNSNLGKHHRNENTISKTRETKIKNGTYDVSGNKNPFYGKHHTEETKKKLSDSHKGNKNCLKNLKRSMPGKSNPLYGKICCTNGLHNIYIDKEELEYYKQLGYRKGQTRRNKLKK